MKVTLLDALTGKTNAVANGKKGTKGLFGELMAKAKLFQEKNAASSISQVGVKLKTAKSMATMNAKQLDKLAHLVQKAAPAQGTPVSKKLVQEKGLVELPTLGEKLENAKKKGKQETPVVGLTLLQQTVEAKTAKFKGEGLKGEGLKGEGKAEAKDAKHELSAKNAKKAGEKQEGDIQLGDQTKKVSKDLPPDLVKVIEEAVAKAKAMKEAQAVPLGKGEMTAEQSKATLQVGAKDVVAGKQIPGVAGKQVLGDAQPVVIDPKQKMKTEIPQKDGLVTAVAKDTSKPGQVAGELPKQMKVVKQDMAASVAQTPKQGIDPSSVKSPVAESQKQQSPLTFQVVGQELEQVKVGKKTAEQPVVTLHGSKTEGGKTSAQGTTPIVKVLDSPSGASVKASTMPASALASVESGNASAKADAQSKLAATGEAPAVMTAQSKLATDIRSQRAGESKTKAKGLAAKQQKQPVDAQPVNSAPQESLAQTPELAVKSDAPIIGEFTKTKPGPFKQTDVTGQVLEMKPMNVAKDAATTVESSTTGGQLDAVFRSETARSESPVQRALQPMMRQLEDGLRHAYFVRPKAVTVKLMPEELGEVKVRVAIEQDQLQARIQTESHKVAAIIKEHQAELEHRMREQGMEFDSFDVGQDSRGGEQGDMEGHQFAGGGGRGGASDGATGESKPVRESEGLTEDGRLNLTA